MGSLYQAAILLSVLCIQSTFGRLTSGVQCIDESGNSVDWWFVYKMPNGFQYAYYDSHSSSGELTIADGTLDCTTGCALGDTLHQIYVAKTTVAHVIYNDEPEGDKSSTSSGPNGGHVKGVVAADKSGGFWMVHSVPKFPDLGPATFTWTASTIYGQSFLCVSLDADGVEATAQQLQYQDPNIYSSLVPTNLQSIYPQLTALLNGQRQVGEAVDTITSSGGTSFTSFAKDNTWGKDLYDDLVEPTFKMAFQWETWRRAPFLPSLCNTAYDTLNVASISIGDRQFSYTQDHSKWGVSLKGSYSCVGGINRMQSQRSRGGGTICLSDSDFWKALSGTVASSEPCTASNGGGPSAVSDSENESRPKKKPNTPKRKPTPVRGGHHQSSDHTQPATPVTSHRHGPAPGRHGAHHGKPKPQHQQQQPNRVHKNWGGKSGGGGGGGGGGGWWNGPSLVDDSNTAASSSSHHHHKDQHHNKQQVPHHGARGGGGPGGDYPNFPKHPRLPADGGGRLPVRPGEPGERPRDMPTKVSSEIHAPSN